MLMKALLSVFLWIASIALYFYYSITSTLMCGSSGYSDLEQKAMLFGAILLALTSVVIGFIPTKNATEETPRADSSQDHAG